MTGIPVGSITVPERESEEACAAAGFGEGED